MGSSFSWHANADSLTSPGEKSVMSDPIEGVTADRLLEGMQKFVREGKTAGGNESKFEVIDKGDYILTALEYEVPKIIGGGSHAAFSTYSFDQDKFQMAHKFYQSKFHYESDQPQCTNMVQIHRDPVRIEFWADFYEIRNAGIVMQGMLQKVLQEMGSAAKANPDSKALDDPTKLSVVSDPITDAEVGPDAFIEFFRKFIVEKMEGTELPDDTVVEERGNLLGLGSKAFAKHEFKSDELHVYCHEFGDDEAMTEEIGITHIQVHQSPFRLEQYNIAKPGRRAGDTQLKLVEGFVSGVMKMLQE